MQTFKQFLAESRTKVVGVEEFIRWADANASGYLGGPNFVYRGNTGTAEKGVRIGNAAKADRPRRSANTSNNYTLWIDNHPSFRGWPKRSLSWIATSDRDMAESFGGPQLLVVSDSSRVGYVGFGDMWETEIDIPMPKGKMSIEDINNMTQEMLGDRDIGSYEELSAAMKAYTLEELRKNERDLYDVMVASMAHAMEKRGLKNLFDLWKFAVRPAIFGGKGTGASIDFQSNYEGEVWIQGEVGFVPHSSRLSDEDAQKIADWSKKHPKFAKELEFHWEHDADVMWSDDDDN